MPHPFFWLPAHLDGLLLGLTTAVTVLLMLWQRRVLRALTGKPGVAKLELTGSPARARDLLADWGPDGRAAVRRHLRIDNVFAPAYGVSLALGTLVAMRVCAPRLGALLGWGALLAALLDLTENALIARTLATNGTVSASVRWTALVAWPKWILALTALAYVLVAFLAHLLSPV